MQLLDKVNRPSDIKNLSTKQLELLCSEIREYMIECCAKNPGHLGSSLGAVELAVALHYVYNTPDDKIIWDVGHQAYAHKILTERREAFKTNRTYKGISGFPKISESIYDAFGTGHSSTSVSAALGMAVAAGLQGKDEKIVAVIGDGALTGGMAFEGLNNAGAMKTDILVILNDNHISIDKGAGSMHNYLLKISTSETYNRVKNRIWEAIGSSRLRRGVQKVMFSTKMAVLRSGSLFESLGFRYFGTIDGNDIGQLTTTLSSLRSIKGPKLLHVVTKKGKGYKPAEEEQTIWHAPGTFDPVSGKRNLPCNEKARFQDVFGETILEIARGNDRVVAITPAMATGCGLNVMMKEIPERTFDVGIAEQHAVTFSAGLAAEGMLPFCNIYSTFMQRAFDSVIHDVALQNLKVMSCFRPIPNIIIASPYDEAELRNLMYSSTMPDYSATILRYPRGSGRGAGWRGRQFEYIPVGKGRILREGTQVALLSVMYCDMRFLKPIDTGILEKCRSFPKIVTVEDGSLIGGLYGAVSEYIAAHGDNCKVTGLGIPDRFIEQGKIQELRKECGFDTGDILDAIMR